jgi:P27 family predicted phage terminase small subunit
MNTPEHLDTVARAKWQEIASTLDTTQPGVADALAAYCVAYSRWTAAEQQVAALGLITRSPAGFPVENPYLGVVKRALIEMHRWGKELGIVTRGAKTKAKEPESAVARILSAMDAGDTKTRGRQKAS